MLITNRGKKLLLEYATGRTARPTHFQVMLITSAVAPTIDTSTFSGLTEIANGNGYATGGYALTPGATDFDNSSQNDTTDIGLVQVKDVAWTATGGSLPASGSGARYALLTDDNVTINSRQVIASWDLGSDKTVSVGQSLTLQNLELDLSET